MDNYRNTSNQMTLLYVQMLTFSDFVPPCCIYVFRDNTTAFLFVCLFSDVQRTGVGLVSVTKWYVTYYPTGQLMAPVFCFQWQFWKLHLLRLSF